MCCVVWCSRGAQEWEALKVCERYLLLHGSTASISSFAVRSRALHPALFFDKLLSLCVSENNRCLPQRVSEK